MTSRAILPPERLEELDPAPVAGTTHMRRAHLDGVRKALARAKPWFKPGQSPSAALTTILLTYLREWDEMYGEGSTVLGLSQTDRTILVIRRDTVQQMMRELAH